MRRSALYVCVLVASLAGEARAFECKLSEQYDYISLAWTKRSIPYGLTTPSVQLDPNLVVRSVNDAFDQWSRPDCTDIRFEFVGDVDKERDDVNKVEFVSGAWDHASDAVALTRTTYGVEDGIIRVATIEVNEATYQFLDASTGCSPDSLTYDITAVLTHEVGHLIGLDHTKFFTRVPSDPTMAPEVAPCEMDKRTIEEDDIEGLCLLYPAGEPPGHCKRIPAQADPYVGNTAFGCSAARGWDSDHGSFMFLALLCALILARKLSPSDNVRRRAPLRRGSSCSTTHSRSSSHTSPSKKL